MDQVALAHPVLTHDHRAAGQGDVDAVEVAEVGDGEVGGTHGTIVIDPQPVGHCGHRGDAGGPRLGRMEGKQPPLSPTTTTAFSFVHGSAKPKESSLPPRSAVAPTQRYATASAVPRSVPTAATSTHSTASVARGWAWVSPQHAQDGELPVALDHRPRERVG